MGSSFTNLNPALHVIFAIVCAGLGGALWAAIAGWLKATRGVHEVISTIMLNWIAIFGGQYLFGLGGPLQDKASDAPVSRTLPLSATYNSIWGFIPGASVTVAIFIALGAAVVYSLNLSRTTLGYEVRAVGLNHIDVWGFRGMAFAKRKLPLVIGAEASGEVTAVGPDVSAVKPGDHVVMYGALTCGTCKACREGRDNLCENVAGIMGFHVDGFARDLVNLPARLVVPVPAGLALRDAACAPIGFATVEHMLFDNAKLQAGETILVHAGGSGIGTAAIQMAKRQGCTVITTVGDDEKAAKAKALGADHVINYRSERFEHVVRKITQKRGVDVVF